MPREKNDKCRHMNGISQGTCDAGIVYLEVARDHPPIDGMGRSFPCIARLNRGHATCPKFELPGDEEFAREQAKFEEAINAHLAAYNWETVIAGYGSAARSWFEAGQPVKSYTFSTMGLRGTTAINTRKHASGDWEARCGVAIFGYSADSTEWESDPFSEEFRDNFIQGHGETEDEALANLKVEGMKMADGLFV